MRTCRWVMAQVAVALGLDAARDTLKPFENASSEQKRQAQLARDQTRQATLARKERIDKLKEQLPLVLAYCSRPDAEILVYITASVRFKSMAILRREARVMRFERDINPPTVTIALGSFSVPIGTPTLEVNEATVTLSLSTASEFDESRRFDAHAMPTFIKPGKLHYKLGDSTVTLRVVVSEREFAYRLGSASRDDIRAAVHTSNAAAVGEVGVLDLMTAHVGSNVRASTRNRNNSRS